LEKGKSKPAIISRSLFEDEERRLIQVLKVNQEVIGWALFDLKCISPYYMHNIA